MPTPNPIAHPGQRLSDYVARCQDHLDPQNLTEQFALYAHRARRQTSLIHAYIEYTRFPPHLRAELDRLLMDEELLSAMEELGFLDPPRDDAAAHDTHT